MFNKICDICDKKFSTKSNTAKYCSSDCKRIAHNESARKYERKNASKCLDCGKSIFRLSARCFSCANKRDLNPSWKGGRIMTSNGYVWVHNPKHPFANCSGYVLEHRLVMEAHLGVYLDQNILVHHKNGKRDDNRLSNLKMVTKRKHSNLHRNFKNGRFE